MSIREAQFPVPLQISIFMLFESLIWKRNTQCKIKDINALECRSIASQLLFLVRCDIEV